MKNVVRRIATTEEFRSLRSEWGNLIQSSKLKSVFLTWEMLYTWWSHYGHEGGLWLVEARANGALAGIAPLMLIQRKKRGMKFRVLQTLGTPHIDVGGFLIRDDSMDVLKDMCQFILDQNGAWDLLEFNEFQQDQNQAAFIMDFFARSKAMYDVEENPHYYLPMQGDWDGFFQSLPKNLRKDINRRRRRAEEAAEIKFAWVQTPHITNEHLELVFDLNEKGNHPDLYRSETDRAFHRALIEAFQDTGVVNIHILYLGGRPVAFQYGFQFDNRYEDWRGAIDLEYRPLSVGKLLLCESLKNCFMFRVKEADFLRGEHAYKEEWNPQARKYIEMRVTHRKSFLAFLNFIFLPRFKRKALSVKFVQSLRDIFNRRPLLGQLIAPSAILASLWDQGAVVGIKFSRLLTLMFSVE